MKDRQVDLTKSVYALCQAYPELIDIMVRLGFGEIAKPGMLATAGRLMTIPKGAKLKGMDMAQVKGALEAQGFTVMDSGEGEL